MRKKCDVFVWTAMIGFNRDEPDKGVSRLLNRMEFTPRGISVLLYHPDIVHQHTGMDVERTLPPDNCSYCGSPRNEEQIRQDWTNNDLRDMVSHLKASGIESYLSIMGAVNGNSFHQEWISDHFEIRQMTRTYSDGLNVLKRFSDGSYYEDFFVDKLCQTLVDYGFDGFHAVDGFCPGILSSMKEGDFSSDMFEQFEAYSALRIPAELAALAGDDRYDARNLRGDWLWNEHRAEWIGFNAWRWEGFWKKVCSRLHKIGKKVIVLGMYCTDPFETLYCLGIDLKRMVNAGVDYLMPNPVPAGLHMQNPIRPYRFHRIMSIIPLTSAYIPDAHMLDMLGVKDSTEEWDILHHMPCLLERDIYSLLSYMHDSGGKLKCCIDGFMVCLGDGIHREEWQWLKERISIAESCEPVKFLNPTLVWSDKAFENTLPAYINTRRWTLHKWYYEMAELGALCGAVTRIENLRDVDGDLFVPNFDLLADLEKNALAAYKNGAVIATAAKNGFSPADWGIIPEIYFEDRFSDYPMCAFAWNTAMKDKDAILALVMADDGVENLKGNPADVAEHGFVLNETLTFCKVTRGFADACAKLIKSVSETLFSCNLPLVTMQLGNNRYRLYIQNPQLTKYGYADVTAAYPVKEVVNIGKYPYLPPKFLDNPNQPVSFSFRKFTGIQRMFRIKVAPGGITIIDVSLDLNL